MTTEPGAVAAAVSVVRGDKASPAAGPATTRLFLARALRDFGDGFVAVLLPVYLTALGLGAFEVGLVATAALLGSAFMTIAIGLLGSRRGHKSLLVAAALLMTATGLAFAGAHGFAVLLVVAFAGTANPSAGGVSLFVLLEHAVLAHVVPDERRTASFATYSLVGALAGALGGFAAASADLMARAGISQIVALKAMFLLYAALGVAAALIYRGIPALAGAPEKRSSPLGSSGRGIFKAH